MNKVRGIKCIYLTDSCGGYIAIYRAEGFFLDIECDLDIRQHQQHRAFNRHLDDTK